MATTTRTRTLKLRTGIAAAGAAAVLAAGLPGHPAAAVPAQPQRRAAADPVFAPTGLGMLSHQGRWLTDEKGRVVLGHGVNMVAKGAQTPAERGFGEDDAQWLQDNGFDTVRLGLSPDALMPEPGRIDTSYLASFAGTVDLLDRHGLAVLVDLHQDGWGPVTSGNGFPEWMTNTHGAENTHTEFPLYYVTNPAIQAAFDSLWANEPATDGTGLQDHIAAMFAALAGAVGDSPAVLGYDILNEPWPGTTWEDCYQGDGCADLDASGLDELHAKVTAAIRSEDPDHLVFGEPYVLFNFGGAPTHIALPGGDPNSGMSWHMYTTEPRYEPQVIANAIAWSDRTGGALLATEFDEAKTTADIERMTGELDNALMPWMWWAYDGFVRNLTEPLTAANIDQDVAGAIVRPHPVQTAGTPLALDFDDATSVLRYKWDATGPDGTTYPTGTETVIKVPPAAMPGGYEITVDGGTVTSPPGAATVTVTTDEGSDSVYVKIWPAGDPEPSDTFPPSPLDTPTDTTTTTTAAATTTTAGSGASTTAPSAGTAAGSAEPAAAVPGTSRYTG